ncbi:hypothetical protein ACRAKI_20285 [Saccharothrix isguenensis]
MAVIEVAVSFDQSCPVAQGLLSARRDRQEHPPWNPSGMTRGRRCSTRSPVPWNHCPSRWAQRKASILLHRVCEQVTTAVPGVDEATIILLQDGEPATVASTSEVVVDLDRGQYSRGDGAVALTCSCTRGGRPIPAARCRASPTAASVTAARNLPDFACETERSLPAPPVVRTAHGLPSLDRWLT